MKSLLMIGFVWPEPKTTAAGERMLQLIRAFLALGYKITFASTASKTEYSFELRRLGVTERSIQLNDSRFDDFIRNLEPTIVVFDRFMVEEQFGWRVAENCPDAIRILNTEDLHSLREYRQECYKKEIQFNSSDWLKTDKTLREVASVYRSDLTLLVSNYEMQLLMERTKVTSSLLLHLPFMLDGISDDQVSSWPKFEDRHNFIAFGNGKHPPNIDSIKFLKSSIWPMIREIKKDAELHIYGAYLPRQVQEMHKPENGFIVHGWVEDLKAEVANSRVVLAPLRFGAGIKGKLTTAMNCGTPSITTKVGYEGMSADLNWPGIVVEDPKEFAKASVELYGNRKKWENAQRNGTDIINSVYNAIKLQKKLEHAVTYVMENLVLHRSENIVGSLLRHQSMAATKYMAKWIEEKNK